MIAGSTPKVPCRHCGFRFYPGHLARHTRACLRDRRAKQQRALVDQVKVAAGKQDPWAPYRTGGVVT